MFQLQILDTLITKDRWRENKVAYLVRCHAIGGDLPTYGGPVRVYGAGQRTVKCIMYYIHQYIPDMDPGPRDEATYVLYLTPGEEIFAGMMISDIPPDELEDHIGK